MAMKTACCGKPLRTVTVILLYINLIVCVWGLLSALTNVSDSSYQQFLKENSNYYLDSVIDVIGALIFLFTIISIYQEKPSFPLLTAAVVFLLFEVFYWIYSVIRLNSGDGMRTLFEIVIEREAQRKPESEREKFISQMKQAYPATVFFVFVVMIAGVAFKLYSALVFYSFKVDWQGRPVYNVPVRQIADDKEINPSAPVQYNIQYTTAPYPSQSGPVQYPGQVLQYPSQPQPYSGLPPQYPSQLPQYPSQLPQYPSQQPPQYPSQPPLYPAQPPQYTYEPK